MPTHTDLDFPLRLPVAQKPQSKPQVAYFCAEFGLEAGLPFYAGGLGILAGDLIKQAADEDFPMIGVGLFYHGKREMQLVDPDGWQRYKDYHFDPHDHQFSEVFDANGKPWQYSLQLAGETVHVFALAKKLSDNVTVYFLETDRPENPWHLRDLTLAPYWGTERQQLHQQLVLGCAGVKLLLDLDLLPETFHVNEGRPAVLVWELAAHIKETQKISGLEALKIAKNRMVYTNHTLVRAGNLSYPMDLVREHVGVWASRLGVAVDELLKPGIDDQPDRFAITEFGLNMSRLASGVSERHTKLCQKEWSEFEWVNVTNGVHFPTWKCPDIQKASQDSSLKSLWQAHNQAKRDLMFEVQRRTGYSYNPEALVLGWARRVVSYKRLDSLFQDVQRLRAVMSREGKPIQLLVAGKAHPGDEQGIRQLQNVIRLFQTELSGLALFVPNYDIGLAQHLVSGVDVWLNTPVDGHEASGTSGMKAAANGVLQASVADGWAAEVQWGGTGWSLRPEDPGIHLLELLEGELSELFWTRNHSGVPEYWGERMKKTQAVAEFYSAARMLREYRELLYNI